MWGETSTRHSPPDGELIDAWRARHDATMHTKLRRIRIIKLFFVLKSLVYRAEKRAGVWSELACSPEIVRKDRITGLRYQQEGVLR